MSYFEGLSNSQRLHFFHFGLFIFVPDVYCDMVAVPRRLYCKQQLKVYCENIYKVWE